MKEKTMEMDIGIRYGDEDLDVLFPRTGQAAAGTISERIREKIEIFSREETGVTISCGVSDDKGEKDAANLVESSDTELYRAKQGGKNRVCVACP